MKYIDVEEMRVVTNDKHITEQIKTDKMKSIVMNGVRREKEKMVKNLMMDEPKIG